MAVKSSNQITFTEHKKIVEIKEWYLATSVNAGITIETAGWTTNIQTIDYTNKYLWNYEEVIYSIGPPDISTPVIIGFYGKGDTGKGIANIVNYYQITKNLVAPELPTSNSSSSWSDTSVVSSLSPVNKYLWNYEAIIYTDGSSTMTEPAIIGVYGDSGTDAITFEIYSVHGFMFKENLESIELKIAAFEGSDAIVGAKYTWEWWNTDTNSYTEIVRNSTNKSITINDKDDYAFASLKCTMSYNGKTYEDYVTLTSETVIYNAVVKLPGGSNIFHAEDLYIIAYIDLYQNNHVIESPFTSVDGYYPGISSVSSTGVITTDLSGNFSNGDKTYFVCKQNDLYVVILGEYTSGSWKSVDYPTQYTYKNEFYQHSNIIAISKESVVRSKNIKFEIWKDDNLITETNLNMIDANDPIIGVEPEKPVLNQLWLDTSKNPSILKICTKINEDGRGQWVECSQNSGGNIYTSQPTSYSEGDLWILAKNEKCVNSEGSFGEGSMLKAKQSSTSYNASHWTDADSISTTLKNNIDQYFTFDPSSGLTIGQSDKLFHVNITSTKMGFAHGENEVVHISYNSANIDNLTAEGDLIVDEGDVSIGKTIDNGTKCVFRWQIEESNGSFSLVRA